MTIKFYYNGFKIDGGKLQKVSYSIGGYHTLPDGTVTIYEKGYTSLKSLRNIFEIEDDSDIQTDYFATATIRVLPSHPLYNQVLEAAKKQYQRFDNKLAA